tara:strand:+ start:3720 stop:6719 length:3000 start_codon:yes stop_codon:yes gene_type:complete
MSVKIEILDYKYGSGDNLVDVNQASGGLSSGWTALNDTNAHWDGSGSGITYLSNISSQSLIIGRTYNLSFKVYNYTGTGDIGFTTSSGVPSTARFSGNTIVVKHFTFVATGTSFPDLYGRSTNAGNISSISITDASVIDWDKSIVGELDVTEHSDFPLALTFQVSDIEDLTSTSGDYSKTFKVPATKNNNKLLKHIYIPSSITDNKVTDMKSCRIIVNGLNSLVGLIQVTGAGGNGETASHYNCTFLGNNLGWASVLYGKYMNNILWGDDNLGLEYKKPNIMATWDDEDCTSSPSDIVYPITSYGEYNPDGNPRTIQLLDTLYANSAWSSSQLGYFGYYNTSGASLYVTGTSYGTPPPSSDWRPAVFVKNTLDKIFSPTGYSISSTFMETPMFKKLVWLLPNFQYNNPDERYNDYSIESRFKNGVAMTAGGTGFPAITEDGIQRFYVGDITESALQNFYWNGAGMEVLDLQSANLTVTLDNGSYVDLANNYVTIGEYGYYKISLNGLQSKVARVYKGGSVKVEVDNVDTRVVVEVQTVGQTSWNPLASGTNVLPIYQEVNEDQAANTVYKYLSPADCRAYLNKGDKIRLRLGIRLLCSEDEYQEFLLWVFYRSTPSSHFDIGLEPNEVAYGQTYDLDKVMSVQDKQVDFIKGVIHAFNLNVTTDEVNKTIHIEPFNDFYSPYSDAIDWTHKIDRSKEIIDKWIKTGLKRKLVFKYKSDGSDEKVKTRGELYFDGVEDEFPYIEELPPTFEQGESVFENPFFAGTYNAKDMDTTGNTDFDTAYSACLWTENVSSNDEGRPEKGFSFLPRLLYWNKYSPAVGSIFKSARVQTWASVIGEITANASVSVPQNYLSSSYPQATMINADSTTSPILSYGNVWVRDFDDATGVYTALQDGKGLYDTYYRNMVEMLKQNPRVRTAYVDLKINDISKLDFRNLVYMDGVYWRISKVIDYKPHRNESTKVELIEWFGLGSSDANAPLFAGNTSQFGNSNITSNSQTTL